MKMHRYYKTCSTELFKTDLGESSENHLPKHLHSTPQQTCANKEKDNALQ